MDINQENTDNAVPKQKTHLFQPGQSGNPKGKPKGTKNHATRLAETLLDGETEKLTRKAVELALSGDTVALKLCLERILPPRKDRPVNIDLPKLEGVEDFSGAMGAITEAVGRGDITPIEAEMISRILENHRKIIETTELESRISALEARKDRK